MVSGRRAPQLSLCSHTHTSSTVLVYLDSAHLALLERAAPAEEEAFWSAWATSGCELALSLHHLQEAGQLSDRGSAERRLKVLERFPLIRTCGAGSERAVEVEVYIQFAQLAGYDVDVQQSARNNLFPIAHLSDLVSSLEFQAQFHQMRAALEIGAEAGNLSKAAARQGPRSDPDAPIDPAIINSPESKAAMEAVLADLPPDAAVLLSQLYEQVRAAILEQGTVRKGLEAIYGLQGASLKKLIPQSDLAAVSVFFNTARREANEICSGIGVGEDEFEKLVIKLNPYASPGFALRLAAERARQLHPKPDKPSDDVDVGHLAFAPYVDLAFVDKRTLGFILYPAM